MQAEFFDSCEFVHFYASGSYVQARAAEFSRPVESLGNLALRDPLATQLGQTLIRDGAADAQIYTESIGQTLLTRFLLAHQGGSSVRPLPKWRLHRVQEYIEQTLSARITLGDMAAVAGSSQMHFADQFRKATGLRPHDYILQRRIEHAKTAILDEAIPLIEAALSSGFQTQSHFTTVFKRLTGETPGEWRRAHERRVRLSSRVRSESRA